VPDERPGAGRTEQFDPFRVGKLAWDAFRGRRAQKSCLCRRLLVFNPFGVQTNPRLIFGGGHKNRALAHGHSSLTPSGFRRTHGQLSPVPDERPGAGRTERFDPFRVGKLGWDVIRGRRAQRPCPCPRLLIFNPFGVWTNPRLIVGVGHKTRALAHGYSPSTPSGFKRTHGQFSPLDLRSQAA
jgi:hypothetical protein